MEIITTDSEDKAVLYQVAADVEIPLTDETKEQIEKMRAFYKSFGDKAGFAAPQVGLSKRIILVEKNLFDTNITDETSEPTILINPIWKPIDNKKELDMEGCLSVPGKVGIVERHVNVELMAFLYCPETKKITKIRHKYHREFSSVLWQHEVDHLDGIVYTGKTKLLLDQSDFVIFRQYLVDSGKIQDEMTLFDIGSLVYDAAQGWEQHTDIQEFLNNKTEMATKRCKF